MSGPVPYRVARYVKAAGLSLEQVRWCRRCGTVAVAIDDYQRRELDRVGFVSECPDGCRRWAS